MADIGAVSRSAVAADTDVDECAALQSRLDAEKDECAQLQALLAKANADKAAAHQAGAAGIAAAKAHMSQLRSELVAVRQWRDEHTGDQNGALAQRSVETEASDADEERKTYMRAKQLEVRTLRHEVARIKHQVELVEAKMPRQEDEIVRLKAELTHTLDILTSTQHAVKHHEVDREFYKGEGDDDGQVQLRGGGHGCIEAQAERIVREGIEGKNIRLSGKAKRLSGVVAAQQLLIQRLEKQILNEEQLLGRKDEQLSFQHGRVAQLKGLIRQNCDLHVANMLGVAPNQPGLRKGPLADNGGALTGSQSLSKLPPI